jgi:hypothetical protein
LYSALSRPNGEKAILKQKNTAHIINGNMNILYLMKTRKMPGGRKLGKNYQNIYYAKKYKNTQEPIIC